MEAFSIERLGLCRLQCIPYFAVKYQETTTFPRCPKKRQNLNHAVADTHFMKSHRTQSHNRKRQALSVKNTDDFTS